MNRDTMTARLIVHDDIVDVFTPFALADIMRSMPSRTWSKTDRCWRINTTFIDLCATSLSAAGCTVRITHPDGRPWTARQSPQPRTTPASSSDWVAGVFRDVPDHHVARLRKSLLAVFHPDVGGSADITRRIIAAAERRSS